MNTDIISNEEYILIKFAGLTQYLWHSADLEVLYYVSRYYNKILASTAFWGVTCSQLGNLCHFLKPYYIYTHWRRYCTLLRTPLDSWFLLAMFGIIFDFEDGDRKFLRNLDEILPDDTSSHPRRRHFL